MTNIFVCATEDGGGKVAEFVDMYKLVSCA